MPEEEGATEMARRASAMASSSRVGSKRMLGPTAMTRRVIGGRVRDGPGPGSGDLVVVEEEVCRDCG